MFRLFPNSLLRAWRRHRDVRRTERALRALSDAALKDIGLHRSEVRSVALAADGRRH